MAEHWKTTKLLQKEAEKVQTLVSPAFPNIPSPPQVEELSNVGDN